MLVALGEFMATYWLYPEGLAEKNEKTGKFIYNPFKFVEMESINQEGHWKIIADSLTELWAAIDQGLNVKHTYSIPFYSFTDLPILTDEGWEIEMNVMSWTEE